MSTSMYIKPLAVVLVILGAFSLLHPAKLDLSEQGQLKKFASEAELKTFLNGSQSYNINSARTLALAPVAAGTQSEDKSSDYSGTNIQVAGVDEADFVKNDGKYIYTISGSSVVIAGVYPAENGKIASIINLSDINPTDLYLNGDRLVVFGNVYNYYGGSETGLVAREGIAMPVRYGRSTTEIRVYDVADRTNPVMKRDIVLNGTYYNSRMIGDYVYAIVNVPTYGDIPVFSPYQKQFEVYYFDVPSSSYQFTNIVSLNMKDDSPIQNKVFLLSYSTNLFVSQDNIYLVYQKQLDQKYLFNRLIDEAIMPNVPSDIGARISAAKNSTNTEYETERILQEWIASMTPEQAAHAQTQIEAKYRQVEADLQKEMQKSVVHKISIKDGSIDYTGKGEVPGQPLNQFSMDEHNGYFRIATTVGEVWNGNSLNNVYVLDANMNVVGKLEDLAKGERIYSVRFLGNRAYMVTFKKVDPLFVIDLSSPSEPKVLGQLKIPGYSDYLHPYDENHIIGIGKNAIDASLSEIEQRNLDFAWYQGVKIALFDVSDVNNPKEVSKYVIGDRGTSSEALYDHRAFLFSPSKQLLVLPIQLAQINRTLYGENPPANSYGDTVWVGAYVFDTTNGFTLKGRIAHTDNFTDYGYWSYQIRRSLYIGDNLYTISQKMIKANSLGDLSEKGKIDLPAADNGPVFAL